MLFGKRVIQLLPAVLAPKYFFKKTANVCQKVQTNQLVTCKHFL